MPTAAIVVNRFSNSAKALANSLGLRRVRPERARRLAYHILFNWGGKGAEPSNGVKVFNTPSSVAKAVNKISTFNVLKAAGVSIPNFRTRRNEINWTGITLARTNLTGSGGDGIVVVREGQPLPEAPLYVQYIKKSAEYRAHVAFGSVIFVQQKRAKTGVEQTEDQKLIRNHANGWVFAENQVAFNGDMEQKVKQTSVNALAALGLDYGAVDIIVDRNGTNCFVLEVNTAPGIESTRLLEAYTAALRGKLRAGV